MNENHESLYVDHPECSTVIQYVTINIIYLEAENSFKDIFINLYKFFWTFILLYKSSIDNNPVIHIVLTNNKL